MTGNVSQNLRRVVFPAILTLLLAVGMRASGHAEIEDSPTSLTKGVVVPLAGESLNGIARRHGMTVSRILELNHGISPRTRQPGDAIVVEEPLLALPSIPDLTREIRRGIQGRKQIALTFDCGWVPEANLRALLDMLEKRDAGATFFVTGIFARRQGPLLRQIHEAGYPIHNHSNTHPHMKRLSDEEIVGELLALDALVEQETGISTRPFWRPPYGERDRRILNIAAEQGFQSVFWTIDSGDSFSSPTLSPEMIFDRVCLAPGRRAPDDADPLDGAIVLLHPASSNMLEALERIMDYFADRGYRLVTVPEIMRP